MRVGGFGLRLFCVQTGDTAKAVARACDHQQRVSSRRVGKGVGMPFRAARRDVRMILGPASHEDRASA